MRRRDEPQQGIDASQLVCEVGVAPVKPAGSWSSGWRSSPGRTSLVSRSSTHDQHAATSRVPDRTHGQEDREESRMPFPDMDTV